jgi:superfamily II DNA/RNA helicase
MNKPSKIQAVSIPLIVIEPNNNLIAFAPTGSGKTGAFAIGSVLRVDRKNPKCQVLCIANTRELCNQIHSVFEKIIRGTDITIANFAKEKNSKQIIVGTHGAVLAL